jgi:hypothetical protein
MRLSITTSMHNHLINKFLLPIIVFVHGVWSSLAHIAPAIRKQIYNLEFECLTINSKLWTIDHLVCSQLTTHDIGL